MINQLIEKTKTIEEAWQAMEPAPPRPLSETGPEVSSKMAEVGDVLREHQTPLVEGRHPELGVVGFGFVPPGDKQMALNWYVVDAGGQAAPVSIRRDTDGALHFPPQVLAHPAKDRIQADLLDSAGRLLDWLLGEETEDVLIPLVTHGGLVSLAMKLLPLAATGQPTVKWGKVPGELKSHLHTAVELGWLEMSTGPATQFSEAYRWTPAGVAMLARAAKTLGSD